MFKRAFTLLLVIYSLAHLSAKEGMWIPTLIEKQIISDMQAEGLQLSTDDIYHVNKACLTDAIMRFSNGCTASFISDKGLILTNHHCASKYIQALSKLENNYLKNGYWSNKYQEDLPAKGLSVQILQYIKDVTKAVLLGVDETLTENQRSKIIRFNTNKLQDSLQQNRQFEVSIKPFFKGNQYLAFIYTEYNDIRLVGAPPTNIANFGGETDNWDWPRHGADFALFRVYANAQNKPDFYNEKNIPLSPKKSLIISMNGVHENDFTMVLGYPAKTNLHASSYALNMLKNDIYPARIALRSIKLEVLNTRINQSDELRLKYSAKAHTIANAYKKWQGEIVGMNRFKVIEKKEEDEQSFQKWIENNPAFSVEYAVLFIQLKTLYKELVVLSVPSAYITELTGKNGMETIRFSTIFPSLQEMSDSAARRNLRYYTPRIRKHFRNFDKETDKQLSLKLLDFYVKNVPYQYIPKDLQKIDTLNAKALPKYVERLFNKTHFADSTTLFSLLDKPPHSIEKSILSDPANRLNTQFSNIQKTKLFPSIKRINTEIDSLNRMYMKALLQFNDTPFIADANSTLRIAYGSIKGYTPKDGIKYMHYTTLHGMFEKEKLGNTDYKVHVALKELYHNKNFGAYGINNTMPVCFLATNHTTGGNSGSPVLNAKGQLIGLNFDRAWEGIMSDLYYTPDVCRNISVDIRYVLFIIDKFAGAKYLLNEMNIVD